MQKIFSGWKRKIGVVTLALACVFCTEWLRSWSIADEARFSIGGRSELIMSRCGVMTWYGHNAQTREYVPLLNGESVWEIPHNLHKDERENRPRLRGLPFDLKKALLDESANVERWSAPHATFVLPMILLSAYLLISKPRSVAQATSTQKAPTTGP